MSEFTLSQDLKIYKITFAQSQKPHMSKTIFPTDDALFKILYLAMMDATKKWTGSC